MIERAYGVTHGGEVFDRWGNSAGKLYIEPSDGLISELNNLPKGSKVGIEHSPDFCKEGYLIDGIEMEQDPTAFYYWGKIEQHCQRNGLEVIYLDDIETYKKYLGEVAKVVKLESELQKTEQQIEYYYDGDDEGDDLLSKEELVDLYNDNCCELPLLKRDIYRHTVIRNYIHQVEREDRLFEKISITQPEIIILGAVHTKNLKEKQNFLTQNLGIEVGKYKFEEPRPFNPNHRINMSDLVSDDIDINFDDSFMTRRQYLALTEGVVIPNGEPDFVGSWNPGIPEKGLFEIYFKDNGDLSGTVEDTLGTASIECNILGKSITFKKKYIKEKSSDSACETEIEYRGILDENGIYRGSFTIGNYGDCGNFWLCTREKYFSSFKPDIVKGDSSLYANVTANLA